MLQYAAVPAILIEQIRKDEAIAEADTLLLTIPKSTRCCPQCARHGGNSDFDRPSARLALNSRRVPGAVFPQERGVDAAAARQRSRVRALLIRAI